MDYSLVFILSIVTVVILILIQYLRSTSLKQALAKDTSVEFKKQLVETASYAAPSGFEVDVIEVIEGLEIRTAVWKVESESTKGTIVIFNGFTEFIEKYYETIGDFKNLGWNVVAFDWRGQGLSSKLLLEKDKGYIEDFNQFLTDADFVYEQKIKDLPEPHCLLGHSMGGHLALREVQTNPDRYYKAVLCAPMQSISGLKTPVLSKVATFFKILGFGQSYVIGGKDGNPNKTHERLTSDIKRFKKWSSIFKKQPRLLMGSATWTWSKAAAISMSYSMQVDQVKKVKIPVYLASAKSDVVVNEETHEALDDINPLIQVVPYESARHEILTESNPMRDKFINDIDLFFSS